MELCTFIMRLMFNSACTLLIHLTSTCHFGHSVKRSVFGKSLQCVLVSGAIENSKMVNTDRSSDKFLLQALKL